MCSPVNNAAEQVAQLARTDDPGHPVVTVQQPAGVGASVVNLSAGLLSGTALMLITLFFLLTSGNALLERIVRLIPDLRSQRDQVDLMGATNHSQDTVEVLRESERMVCRYIALTTCINGTLGLLLAIGFHLAGMPNPMLWGVLAGVANFLPYIGPMGGILVVALVSIISFHDRLGQALVPPLIYAGLAFLEGNFITPALVGRRLAMSPLALFLWMAAWAWMWGILGALIAVPLLVMTREFCSRVKPLAGFAELLEP